MACCQTAAHEAVKNLSCRSFTCAKAVDSINTKIANSSLLAGTFFTASGRPFLLGAASNVPHPASGCQARERPEPLVSASSLARGALKFARLMPEQRVAELHAHLGRLIAVESVARPVKIDKIAGA